MFGIVKHQTLVCILRHQCFILQCVLLDLILRILPYMPSVTPCTFVNRKMHTMLLSHCFCCPKCNFLIWVRNLRLSAASRYMAILTEYPKGIVSDKYISPRPLSCQLIPNGKNAVPITYFTFIHYFFLFRYYNHWSSQFFISSSVVLAP